MTGSGRLTDTTDPDKLIELMRRHVGYERTELMSAAADEIESLRAQLAAARRTEAETKAEALTELRAEIVKEGRSVVEWLAKTAGDAVDRARLMGAEDAYKDTLRILDARRAAVLLAQPEEPEVKHDPDCGKANGRGDGCICVELRAIRALAQPEPAEPKLTCALCGHEPHNARTGYHGGRANFDWLCHEDDHSCYHRWTVYGDRPAPAGAVVPETQQP